MRELWLPLGTKRWLIPQYYFDPVASGSKARRTNLVWLFVLQQRRLSRTIEWAFGEACR